MPQTILRHIAIQATRTALLLTSGIFVLFLLVPRSAHAETMLLSANTTGPSASADTTVTVFAQKPARSVTSSSYARTAPGTQARTARIKAGARAGTKAGAAPGGRVPAPAHLAGGHPTSGTAKPAPASPHARTVAGAAPAQATGARHKMGTRHEAATPSLPPKPPGQPTHARRLRPARLARAIGAVPAAMAPPAAGTGKPGTPARTVRMTGKAIGPGTAKLAKRAPDGDNGTVARSALTAPPGRAGLPGTARRVTPAAQARSAGKKPCAPNPSAASPTAHGAPLAGRSFPTATATTERSTAVRPPPCPSPGAISPGGRRGAPVAPPPPAPLQAPTGAGGSLNGANDTSGHGVGDKTGANSALCDVEVTRTASLTLSLLRLAVHTVPKPGWRSYLPEVPPA
jgi:hypothetical protein